MARTSAKPTASTRCPRTRPRLHPSPYTPPTYPDQKSTGVIVQFGAAPARLPLGGALFVFDFLATALSIVFSLILRFETINLDEALLPYLPIVLLPLLVRPPVRVAFGLYRREWRFASTGELRDILGSIIVGSVIIVALYGVAAFFDVPGSNPFPRSFFLIEPLTTAALVGGARFVLRMRIESSDVRKHRDQFTRTLIYGAGEAGASLARASARDERLGIHVVGFLDDDVKKHGSRLLGHRVYGGIQNLTAIVKRTDSHQLLLAMPSRTGAVVRRAVQAGHELGLEVKTVPPIRDLLTGEIQVAPPRRISVEDLLRRPPVELDIQAIAGYLNGASVVVTGGGGSIGGELVRQILRVGPRVLTVIDYQEAALWNVERDAASLLDGSGVRLNPVLADVRSLASMTVVIGRANPDVVFHAAALKHVPYVEMHPSEGFLTNVVGTRNVLAASEAASVARFVLISTDKAVEPVSIMGITKYLAEDMTVEAGQRLRRPYSAVRFGNVLGSSGSLIPLLDRQLEDGLPLTITEPNATRYFMILSEAVMLVLEAGSATSPGEIYVLDMGAPVRIGDLVEEFIRLKGMAPDVVVLKPIGLRPGEKLHEKLYFDAEIPEPTAHAGISRARWGLNTRGPAWTVAQSPELEDAALTRDDYAVRRILSDVMSVTGTVQVPRGG